MHVFLNLTSLYFIFQLQVLIEDSTRLQRTYPGENAEQIEQLQATVVENWGILQDRAIQRKEELVNTMDLHRFLADVGHHEPYSICYNRLFGIFGKILAQNVQSKVMAVFLALILLICFEFIFFLKVRDLMSWANEIEQEMKSEKTARDVYGVDMIKTRHEELKAEIDARAETFTTIIQTGEEMINNEHYAKSEVPFQNFRSSHFDVISSTF